MRKIFLFALSFFTLNGLCQYITHVNYDIIDGLRYELKWTENINGGKMWLYATLLANDSNPYCGDIVIPENVNYNNDIYKVIAIGGGSAIHHNGAFSGCEDLTSVVIPESVEEIGAYSFSGCTGLTSLILPDHIKQIHEKAFDSCINLTELELPYSLEIIEGYAFNNCSKIERIIIPSKVKKLGQCLFSGCSSLKTLVILANDMKTNDGHSASYTNPFKYLPNSTKIYSLTYTSSGYSEIRLPSITRHLFIDDIVKYIKGCSFTARLDDKIEDLFTLNELTFYNESILPTEMPHTYFFTNLPRWSNDYIKIGFIYKNHEIKDSITVSTARPTYNYNNITVTQTTAKFGIIEADEDITANVIEKYYIFNGVRYNEDDVAENLIPNKEYSYDAYIKYAGDENADKFKTYFKTKGLSPTVTNLTISPTSFTGTCGYTLIDAHLSSAQVYFNNQLLEGEGNHMIVTGLNPNSNYNLKYIVKTIEGSTETFETTIKTNSIQFSTLAPKVTNAGEAIVGATTNIADEETRAGFEWRKTDAPDVVVSKFSDAIVFQGSMEGKLLNLSTDSYWKVRPYYKSATDNTFYGEWIGFDPMDFSFFEPSVHTYSTPIVNGSSVVLTGTAIAGSDAILEQGFEYWITNCNANGYYATPSTVQHVTASGQRMSATLYNLSNNVYAFRSYIVTSKGTSYGEEQTFIITDGVSTGIEFIVDSECNLDYQISGYYDLNGRRISKPDKGIIIVRYSNGTARKAIIK